MLVRTLLNERRRPWSRVRLFDRVDNGVRVALRGGVGFAQGDARRAELDALGRSVRRDDPPLTNPFR